MTSQETNQPSASDLVGEMIWQFTVSQGVYVAAKLGLFDLLREGPRHPSEISAATGADERSLKRLCRALISVGLLTENDQGRFTATETGAVLRSDHPQSQRAMAVFLGSFFVWEAWGKLLDAVMTGKSPFEQQHGVTFFDFLEKHPAEADVFNAAMTGLTHIDIQEIAEAYDFSGFRKIIDVGGGQGFLLRSLLERNPLARGALVDIPSVIADAQAIHGSTVEDRCELFAADMFQWVPPDGDVYLLRLILHDWDDAQCVQLLRNIRRGMDPDGQVLVIDAVMKPVNEPDERWWTDLHMLVLHQGRERTEAEFRDLFTAASLELSKVIPIGGASILVGIPSKA